MNAFSERPVSASEVVRALARPLPTLSQAAVIATTANGRIIFWNRAAERLLGWPAREVLHRQIFELGPRHVRERTAEFVAVTQARVADRGDTVLWRRTGIPIACFTMMIVLGDVARGGGVMVGVSVAAAQRIRLKRDGPRIRLELHRRLKLLPPKRPLPSVHEPKREGAGRRANFAGRYEPLSEPMYLARALLRRRRSADIWSRMQIIEASRLRAERSASEVAGPRARRAAAMWLRVAGQLRPRRPEL